MKRHRIQPGTLVELPDGRGKGIVIRSEPTPRTEWLAEQVDEAMRRHRDSAWWAVMPITGGLILLPSPLIRPGPRASLSEVLAAVEHATPEGRRSLASIFPELVRHSLKHAFKQK